MCPLRLSFFAVKQVFPELVAEIDINLFKSTFAMNEVVEMLIYKRPFLVVLGKLLAVIFQKIGFEPALVKEIIPFIDNGFKTAAPDSFRLFRHGSVEVPFTLVLRIGIDVDVQSFVANGLHRFLIPVARIIIKVEGQHTFLQWACPQCYCFTF